MQIREREEAASSRIDTYEKRERERLLERLERLQIANKHKLLLLLLVFQITFFKHENV